MATIPATIHVPMRIVSLIKEKSERMFAKIRVMKMADVVALRVSKYWRDAIVMMKIAIRIKKPSHPLVS